MVSEYMLQQTQVIRVIPYFNKFIKAFPTLRALASASPASVLRLWSGLGYNRRGIHLLECAKKIVSSYRSRVPQDVAVLKTLPGIGDYTARAIRCFAFNQWDICIETNIRTILIYHYFPDATDATITDDSLRPILDKPLQESGAEKPVASRVVCPHDGLRELAKGESNFAYQ